MQGQKEPVEHHPERPRKRPAGQWLRCIFDEDSTWYWLGLWRVDVVERGRTEITFSIEGTCNPYKRNITADAGADWLWDTFDFETDTIYDTPTGVISL